MVISMAKLRMAHASTHGACKKPGPKDTYFYSLDLTNNRLFPAPDNNALQVPAPVLHGHL